MASNAMCNTTVAESHSHTKKAYPNMAITYNKGLGLRGLEFRGLGFGGLGFRGLGFRSLGLRGLGIRV